eukprot:CAMPEP_0185691384 /NCGR_PEP_ID=MMETSP1164-20130828/1796_1 /TAXON_ID=1104430 /ORGANISM="Chrysoreinhardia sp, Strain CCMP2950" /LENGTH=59 /DNA_ID=CAMNT_0028358039 /DNA_START=185 /DNA_END=364 /DNA_ORIENTATION=-
MCRRNVAHLERLGERPPVRHLLSPDRAHGVDPGTGRLVWKSEEWHVGDVTGSGQLRRVT